MRIHLKQALIRSRRKRRSDLHFENFDAARCNPEDLEEDEDFKNACDSIIQMVHQQMIEKLKPSTEPTSSPKANI